ncbi:alpha-2-macroglobulin family protein [Flavitalea antarctica]
MRITLLVVICLLSWPAFSQNNLSGSPKSGQYTYAYRLNPDEAFVFAKLSSRKPTSKTRRLQSDFIEKILARTVKTDSFPVADPRHKLAPGNYLFVTAIKNKLHGELKTYGDLEFKLVENNHDLAIYLHKKTGEPIMDATVRVGNKIVPYNAGGQYYLLKNTSKKGVLRVLHNKILYCADIGIENKEINRPNELSSTWTKIKKSGSVKFLSNIFKKDPDYNYQTFFNDRTDYEAGFKGFMVFNKPIYKPGDTVRVKAFVTTSKGKPVKRKMILRLSDAMFNTDTILSVIVPYTNGGYDYSFVLNEDLDLTLDDNYLLTLEEVKSARYNIDEYDGNLDEDEYAMKRKVVMRNTFYLEEYELKSITFKIWSDKNKTHRGEQNFLYLKASDENGLPVLDGRVEVLVESIHDDNLEFHERLVYLKDTLFSQNIKLEPVGDTRITIPDSVFPAVSFNYKITCNFLNPDNEIRTQTIINRFEGLNERISFELLHDSLEIKNSSPTKRMFSLIAINFAGDTVLEQSITLPAKIKLNAFVSMYKVSDGLRIDSFELNNSSQLVSCAVLRTRDSLAITFVNPHSLPAWYTIFAGKNPIQRSIAGDTTIYLKSVTKKNYFISVQYVYGNQVNKKNYTIPFYDKQLQVDVEQPAFIYPGQTAEIKINLKDISGQPVRNADLTAWAYTKKFENGLIPPVPYYGKIHKARQVKNDYLPVTERRNDFLVPLNWVKWSKEMKLDSIEYYKFLYPSGIYHNHQPAPGQVTQIAPFVVSNGQLQQIHLLYIDEHPIFFSNSQDLSRYSFVVNAGKHSIRIRTNTAIISVDSIHAFFGMKNVLSISLDSVSSRVRIEKMPSKLTPHETALWSRYMILIESNFGENMAYIKQQNRVFALNQLNSNFAINKTNLLVGPLKNNEAQLVVKTEFDQSFEVEGTYHYIIRKGLIKQKQLPTTLSPTTLTSFKNMDKEFSDLAMTEKEIDSLWRAYLDERSQNENLFWNRSFSTYNGARLQIAISHDPRLKPPFVRQVIVFKKDNADFIRMFKGNARDLGYFDPGVYRIFLLLRDDEYFIKEEVVIKPNGLNYYLVNVDRLRRKDSLSTTISNTIDEKGWNRQFESGTDFEVIKRSFNTVYLDPKTFSRTISGKILDDKKKPVSGAVVTIKGSLFSTTSDDQGFFSLATPNECTILIGAVGYTAIELNAASMAETVILKPTINALSEVVVVGYGTSKKKELTGSITTLEGMSLQGRVSGIVVSGISSNSSGNAPLIILDGLPYSGKLEGLDKSLIKDINILNGVAATSLYGQAGANGVIVVTSITSATKDLNDEGTPQSPNSIRKNFRDHAYWEPRLRTDANGNAGFITTFPDDITNWKTFVVAMADKKRTGFATGNIRSFKTVSAGLGLPAFLVAGDSIKILGKAQNYQADTITVNRVFKINDSIIDKNRYTITSSRIDTFAVGIPDTDSISFTYSLQRPNGYTDGEHRKLEVVKAGVVETTGMFAALDRDTSFLLSTSTSGGEVTIHAEAGILPILLDEAEQIRSYAYFCNEQMASKLKALIQLKIIYKHLGKEFRSESDITELISRITKTASANNLWGWWKNDQPQLWISRHVLEALLLADQNGYRILLNKPAIISHLVYILDRSDSLSRITSLGLLHMLAAKVDYKSYLDTLNKYRHKIPRQSALELMALRQKLGYHIELDSIVRRSGRTMMGNLYWGDDGYNLLNNSIINTITIYKMMRVAGGYDTELAKVRNYFFEKRRDGKWRNTYESSLILETILPDLLKEGSLDSKPHLQLSGATTTIITDFPFTHRFPASDSIKVTKTGKRPVYFTSYQQKWNDRPVRVESDFVVTSTFEKNGVKLNKLTAGKTVELKVRVNVKADGNYVMVEIPIPSGCSYESKPQPISNNEVHREYFKNKVSIFCSYLKKGSYTFTIPLMPRYTGKFILNPAKAELMYFPIFYGREEMKKIEIN